MFRGNDGYSGQKAGKSCKGKRQMETARTELCDSADLTVTSGKHTVQVTKREQRIGSKVDIRAESIP